MTAPIPGGPGFWQWLFGAGQIVSNEVTDTVTDAISPIAKPLALLSSRSFWIRASVVAVGGGMVVFALGKLFSPALGAVTDKAVGLVGTAVTGGTGKAVSTVAKGVAK